MAEAPMPEAEAQPRVAHYFAYGSNLLLARMQQRIVSAVPLSRAYLQGYRVRFDKRGQDGTAKANLAACADSRVWGQVYQLADAHIPQLDAVEGGYQRESVSVWLDSGQPLTCFTYRSDAIDPQQRPARWYVSCVLSGAHAMQLPQAHLRALQQAVLDAGGEPFSLPR